MELDLDQQQRFQQVWFREGFTFDGEEFGTAVTCLAFKHLDDNGKPKSGVASPTGPVTLRNSVWALGLELQRRGAACCMTDLCARSVGW